MPDQVQIAHQAISGAIKYLSKDCPHDNYALHAISILLAARKTVLQ